jgi:Carboxypeptidase regulatory-like domain
LIGRQKNLKIPLRIDPRKHCRCGYTMKELLFFFAFVGMTLAQTPSGMIEGSVLDPSGAAVSGAEVTVASVQTGVFRPAVTTDLGTYSFPGLLPGEYRVEVKAKGFPTLVRPAVVQTGGTTTADLHLVVGELTESIAVEGASPQIRYDSYSVSGSILRGMIEGVPLNGLNFAELAKLEPGVQTPAYASSNRMFIPTLGGPGGNSGRATRGTIDGGSIMAINNGGMAMRFSQEAVEEFQVCTVNFDLSTGATFSGVINAVTRSGGNAFHGTAFYFLRDHNFAAYPALRRDPANPDPFFQRRQFGLALGGPIRGDRVFFFGSLERNEQRGVGTTTLTDPDFSHLSRITVSPFFGNQATIRLDGRLSSTHTAFLRYSHDGNHAFGASANARNAYPSSWTLQTGWTDQSLIGVTSAFPALVNEFRFSYFYASAKQLPPRVQDCPGCLGVGAPLITVSGLALGGTDVFLNVGRRFQLNDVVTWQLENHRIRFGVDWEHDRGGPTNWANEPAALSLFSPTQARDAGLSVPAQFETLDDILALPLSTVTVGVGDPRVPQPGGGTVRRWDTAHLFIQDVWRLRPRLAVSYGLGWSVDRNLNYDLSKPRLLAPILGEDGLGPTRKEWKNFSPALGFVWTPSANGETVVRAGAGLFYDFLFNPNLDAERAALGPPGLGRRDVEGVSIQNPLPGIPDVPVDTFLDFHTKATSFTGANLIEILPTIRDSLLQDLDNTLEAAKTQSDALNGRKVSSPSAVHVNVGLQRRVAKDFVVSADLVYRHFNHLGIGSVDMNHYDSVRGPVIPKCATTAERENPQVMCSTGPIRFLAPVGRAGYKGLLVRAEKRFSHGLQFLGSWAYSRNTGTGGSGTNGFNLDNWLENRGPLPTDLTHILNLAGVARLPWQLGLGLNFSYSSAPPFSAYLGRVDLNGDGTQNDLLPGSTVNVFNRGMGRHDLERLVAEFNQTVDAGKRDPFDKLLPRVTLPSHYALADNFHALDLRLSRSFQFRDGGNVALIGDLFNVYNAANLSGYSGDLTNRGTFGQPTARSSQVFGSGGPRAFQLAVKVSF